MSDTKPLPAYPTKPAHPTAPSPPRTMPLDDHDRLRRGPVIPFDR